VGGIIDISPCAHINTDSTWSGGQNLERCLDCGGVKEEGAWVDIPGKMIALLVAGKTDAARELLKYMNVAREEHGIPYPETTWIEYCYAALQIVELKEQEITH
jgi:hypothetical protein